MKYDTTQKRNSMFFKSKRGAWMDYGLANEELSVLLLDFYKCFHNRQYPKCKRLVAYMTPRMSRIGDDFLINYGEQAFNKEYLVTHFNRFFFSLPKDFVIKEYKRILDNTVSPTCYDIEKIEQLHDLGYLPLRIRTLKEGTKVPVKVPMIEITNTHDDFAWVVNVIESLMSCTLWHTMISANVGYNYRQIVNKYWGKTVEDSVPRHIAVGDFSFRGQESLESSRKSSAAFLLSFSKTATVPVVRYLERYYNCDCSKTLVGKGGVSTEHSVMNTNFAIDKDERTFIKKLLTEKYPNDNFSAVLDSYDYWNVIDNILPSLKEEIMNHNGIFFTRGDSGDPIDISTKTVFKHWDNFGGTINSKGYKVLHCKIRAIYGDSITPQRLLKIYEILEANGFSCENVLLGAGSFSFQCLEEMDLLKPYTRDTFGMAVKTVYMEDENGNPINVFKDPKTDKDAFKKSQRGCCLVYLDDNGKISYKDGFTYEEVYNNPENLFITVFEDSVIYNEISLIEVRDELNDGKF